MRWSWSNPQMRFACCRMFHFSLLPFEIESFPSPSVFLRWYLLCTYLRFLVTDISKTKAGGISAQWNEFPRRDAGSFIFFFLFFWFFFWSFSLIFCCSENTLWLRCSDNDDYYSELLPSVTHTHTKSCIISPWIDVLHILKQAATSKLSLYLKYLLSCTVAKQYYG